MVSLIVLVMCAIGLLNALLNRFPSVDRKPKNYHEPMAKPGRNGSYYFDDYDYFHAGIDGECICQSCLEKRFPAPKNK